MTYLSDLIPVPGLKTHLSLRDTPQFFPSLNYPVFELEQVHGDQIFELKEPFPSHPIQADAIISQLTGQYIGIRTADCLPILLYHPLPVIAAIHAGRKGSLSEITAKVLHRLKKNYDIHSNVHAYLGPRICVACYEIHPETRTHFDLLSTNIEQLYSVMPDITIIDSGYCSHCDNQQFFSHRRHDTGRSHSLIGLEKI